MCKKRALTQTEKAIAFDLRLVLTGDAMALSFGVNSLAVMSLLIFFVTVPSPEGSSFCPFNELLGKTLPSRLIQRFA